MTHAMWTPAAAPGPEAISTESADRGHALSPSGERAEVAAPAGSQEETTKSSNDNAQYATYNAQALKVELTALPTAGKTVETLEVDVRAVCFNHGVALSRDTSERAPNAGRLKSARLKCVHGMRSRQEECQQQQQQQQPKPGGTGTGNGQGVVRRTGCKFVIHIRWPLDDEVHPHPRLTTMALTHDHEVDATALTLRLRSTTPLTLPMSRDVRRMTDAGISPALQARFLNAVHGGEDVSIGAVQIAAAQRRGQQIDGDDIYQQILEATGGYGVCKVKLDTRSCRDHSFRVTECQVSATHVAAEVGTESTTSPLPIKVLWSDGEFPGFVSRDPSNGPTLCGLLGIS